MFVFLGRKGFIGGRWLLTQSVGYFKHIGVRVFSHRRNHSPRHSETTKAAQYVQDIITEYNMHMYNTPIHKTNKCALIYNIFQTSKYKMQCTMICTIYPNVQFIYITFEMRHVTNS